MPSTTTTSTTTDSSPSSSTKKTSMQEASVKKEEVEVEVETAAAVSTAAAIDAVEQNTETSSSDENKPATVIGAAVADKKSKTKSPRPDDDDDEDTNSSLPQAMTATAVAGDDGLLPSTTYRHDAVHRYGLPIHNASESETGLEENKTRNNKDAATKKNKTKSLSDDPPQQAGSGRNATAATSASTPATGTDAASSIAVVATASNAASSLAVSATETTSDGGVMSLDENKTKNKTTTTTTTSDTPPTATATDDTSASADDIGVVDPHDHDVLSGRGNSVNHHPGNEYFRSLVRHHKVAYVGCPKPQKEQFSKMIVSTIHDRQPPGRFLKQNPTTKLWHNIGAQKSLDKTRQALREGAPATVAGLMLSHGMKIMGSSTHARNRMQHDYSAMAPSSTNSSNAVVGKKKHSAKKKCSSQPRRRSSVPDITDMSNIASTLNNNFNPMVGGGGERGGPLPPPFGGSRPQTTTEMVAMAAAHSRMLNTSPYYNASAMAMADAAIGMRPLNAMNASAAAAKMSMSNDSGNASELTIPTSNSSSTPNKPSKIEKTDSNANYPPYSQFAPPVSNSDAAMAYHAAQFLKMAAANNNEPDGYGGPRHGNNDKINGNSGDFSSQNPAALAAAAGTLNPVLLEHFMNQYRGDSNNNNLNPKGNRTGGPDEVPSPQRSSNVGSGGNGETEEGQNSHPRDAYVTHLQDKVQQQEKQLRSLCSHILTPQRNEEERGDNKGDNDNSNSSSSSSKNNDKIRSSSGNKNNNFGGANYGGQMVPGIPHSQNPMFDPLRKMHDPSSASNNMNPSALQEYQNYAQLGFGGRGSGAGNSGMGMGMYHQQQLPQMLAAQQAMVNANGNNFQPYSNDMMMNMMMRSYPGMPPMSFMNPQMNPSHVPPNMNIEENFAPSNTNSSGKATGKEKGKKKKNSKGGRDDGEAVAALMALGIGVDQGDGSPSTSVDESETQSVDSNDKGGNGSLSTHKKRKLSSSSTEEGENQDSSKKVRREGDESGAEENEKIKIDSKDSNNAKPNPAATGVVSMPWGDSMPQQVMSNNTPIEINGQSLQSYLYDPVTDPHIHDVLCGRGALTNEHPGNEWFRRLVRYNRQLYRSCPKHTKLLVAKAIVQAVQRTNRDPPGRFLERTKPEQLDEMGSDSWTPITYKCAVEKASQALREKVSTNFGAPGFPLSKALEAASAVAFLEKEYPSNDGGTNLLALIIAVLKSAGLE